MLRPDEIPTAEVYSHEVPGDRPAAEVGHRQGDQTWDLLRGKTDQDQFGRGKGRQFSNILGWDSFFWMCLGRNQTQ